MKRLLLVLGIMGLSSAAFALDAQYPLNFRPSTMTVTHTTVAFSSVTAASLESAAGGYWEVTIATTTSPYRYTLNGSSASITTIGMRVPANTMYTITGPYKIWLMLDAGAAAETRNVMTIEPRR